MNDVKRKDAEERSPYLKAQRLPDVMAALQVMALEEPAEHPVKKWAEKLSRNTSYVSVRRWGSVFEEHPEFFLSYHLNGEEAEPKAVLRARYINRDYDRVARRCLAPEDIKALSATERANLTFAPLGNEALNNLMKAAMEMHSRAIAANADQRWWVPIAPSVITAAMTIVTGVLGFYAGKANSTITPSSLPILTIEYVISR